MRGGSGPGRKNGGKDPATKEGGGEEEKLRWVAGLARLQELVEGQPDGKVAARDEDRPGEAGKERQLRSLAGSDARILSRKGGDLGVVVRALGQSLVAPHMESGRIREFFGEKHEFPELVELLQIARWIGGGTGARAAVQKLQECGRPRRGGHAQSSGACG